MKTVKLLLPLCLLLTLLCACGGPKPASEAQLREDLEDNEVSYYSEQLQAQITKFDVVKRQTVAEDQKDTAWVQVSIEGPEVRGTFHYIMSYGLYNDGWKLENVQQDRESGWRIEPLAPPDVNLASQLPPDAELTFSSVDLEANVPYATYEYTYTETYPYCEVIYKKAFDYAFDYNVDGAWYFKQSRDAGTVENWSIDGTWSMSQGSENYFALHLDGFSPQGIAADGIENAYWYNADGWYRERYYFGTQFDKTDNGPFSCSVDKRDDYGLPISYSIFVGDSVVTPSSYDINYYGVFTNGGGTQLNRESNA